MTDNWGKGTKEAASTQTNDQIWEKESTGSGRS